MPINENIGGTELKTKEPSTFNDTPILILPLRLQQHLFSYVTIRHKIDTPHRTTLLTNAPDGEKCTSSPKQPQDSMLPARAGTNRFIPVNNTKNESNTKDMEEANIRNLRCSKSNDRNSSDEHTEQAISKQNGTKTEDTYNSEKSITSIANECTFTAFSSDDAINTNDNTTDEISLIKTDVPFFISLLFYCSLFFSFVAKEHV